MKTNTISKHPENIYGVRRRIKRLEKTAKYQYWLVMVAYILGLATQLIIINVK